MKHLLISGLLIFIIGCAEWLGNAGGIEQTLQGTTDEEYIIWLQETQHLRAYPMYSAPRPYFNPSPFYFETRPPEIINPDGSTNMIELMRRWEINEKLDLYDF